MKTSSVVKKASIAGDNVCSLKNLAYKKAPGNQSVNWGLRKVNQASATEKRTL